MDLTERKAGRNTPRPQPGSQFAPGNVDRIPPSVRAAVGSDRARRPTSIMLDIRASNILGEGKVTHPNKLRSSGPTRNTAQTIEAVDNHKVEETNFLCLP